MSRFKFVAIIGLALALGGAALASVSFIEDFSTNPFTAWSFGIGSTEPSTNRFVWNSTAPSVYAGDPVGALTVHLNSSLPTVRLQRPLGVTVTDANDFLLKVRFSFSVTSAPTNQSMQIAFGLVNSSQTGGNRTGSDGVFVDDDTFHTVEFNYFPQISTFSSPPTGPNLSPAVFGAHKPGNDAFGNFAAYFFSEADLHDNTNGIHELPQNVILEAALAYRSATRTIALTMRQVNGGNSTTLLETEVPPMSLINLPTFGTYDTNFPFAVDAVAIMAYRDGFTTTNDPSLVADITFQRVSFYAPPPEPPSVTIAIANTDVVLTFRTVSNYVYDVESRTDLTSGSWSTVASNIAGTSGLVTNVDIGAATAPRRFYRIGVTVP